MKLGTVIYTIYFNWTYRYLTIRLIRYQQTIDKTVIQF